MSWFPSSGVNQQLLSIYKNNIKDRIKALKKAKRIKVFAEEVALVDPNRLTIADYLYRSTMNRLYLLFADQSEIIRKAIEAETSAWFEWKQDKDPFPLDSMLENLLEGFI